MSNDWYENTLSLAKGTNARAEDVESKFDEVEVGFDKLPDEADLKNGTISYAVSTGSANAYILALSNITEYADGTEIVFKANHANTGAATVDVNSLGVKSLRRQNGAALASGDIPANKIVSFRYNSTSGYFEMQLITAGDMTDVATVAGISTDVSAVAAIDSDVTTVAGIDTDVTTVSGISANVTTVAGISADVSAVAGISEDVTTVAGISANVATVAGISTDVTTVAGISGDVTTVAGISADVTTVAGISDDVSTVADMGADSFQKVFRRSIFTYNGGDTAYTVKVGAGWYYVKDKLAKWTSELTTGAIPSPVADTRYYLYLDYSGITSGTDITASELIWSSTAPTYSHTYQGWYNGDDLCIFYVRTNPSNIYTFYHDGQDYVQLGNYRVILGGLAVSDSWIDADASIGMPAFSTRGNFFFDARYVDANGFLMARPNGSPSSGIFAGNIHTDSPRSGNTTQCFTDSSQIIEVSFSSPGSNTCYVYLIGWYFPEGM